MIPIYFGGADCVGFELQMLARTFIVQQFLQETTEISLEQLVDLKATVVCTLRDIMICGLGLYTKVYLLYLLFPHVKVIWYNEKGESQYL